MSSEEKKRKVVLAQIEAAGEKGCALSEIVAAFNEWVANNPDGGLEPAAQGEIDPIISQLEEEGITFTAEDGTVHLVEQQ